IGVHILRFDEKPFTFRNRTKLAYFSFPDQSNRWDSQGISDDVRMKSMGNHRSKACDLLHQRLGFYRPFQERDSTIPPDAHLIGHDLCKIEIPGIAVRKESKGQISGLE